MTSPGNGTPGVSIPSPKLEILNTPPPRCDACRHWVERDVSKQNSSSEARTVDIEGADFGEAAEEPLDGETIRRGLCLMAQRVRGAANRPETKALALDESNYRSYLLTDGDFGCVQWEALDVTIKLSDLADGEGRQSAKVDLGDGSVPRYEVTVCSVPVWESDEPAADPKSWSRVEPGDPVTKQFITVLEPPSTDTGERP